MNARSIADSRKTRAIKKVKRNRAAVTVLIIVFTITYLHALWTWINYGG